MFCENLESSKNAKLNIGIHPQALIRHFKPIINHKNPTSTTTNAKQSKTNLFFPPIEPLPWPVSRINWLQLDPNPNIFGLRKGTLQLCCFGSSYWWLLATSLFAPGISLAFLGIFLANYWLLVDEYLGIIFNIIFG